MKNKKTILSSIVILIIILGAFIFNSQRISYTKEFTYHPKYKNMQVQKSESAKRDNLGNAVYKVKGTKYKSYLKGYKRVLEKDGWKIIKDNNLENIEAKKDGHITKINVVDAKDHLIVLVWTK
ncbi:hypothetical protein [Clostridium niameyense]|uniref:hypothetical protein n=1 Tax=Clostridium niameyense TaxID=1622073 RepID=UPI00067EE91B|nr:hypothetical protein [Clostridium niameyense]